jgi:hypothetical protein
VAKQLDMNYEVQVKAACFEEKIHREVEKVEEGSQKTEAGVKTFLTSSPSW